MYIIKELISLLSLINHNLRKAQLKGTSMDASTLLIIAVLVIAVFIIIRILKKPIRFLFKLLLNALFGFIGLVIVNFFGDIFGISIAINLFNCLIVGVLGLPGLILLLIL